MAKIRLTHIDGKLPNLALMKLAHWHKAQGDEVYLTRNIQRELFEPEYDTIYGSAIFTFSHERLDLFKSLFPQAIIGGTGSKDIGAKIETITGEYEHYDYSIYPDYKWSLGFTQRGCRLNCKFCIVPKKEGRPRSVNTIHDIWKDGSPKNICLLDNDFFGQDKDQWLERIKEIKDGGFKVAFNQGVNIRLITEESAHWLGQILYYDDQFKKRRLYTAWDNLKDEKIFFEGVNRLERAGVPPYHLMVYMLVGFDKDESMERVMYRFRKMTERGIRPYPMVYNNADKELKMFQRWAVRKFYEFVSWDDFTRGYTKPASKEQMAFGFDG